MAGAGFTTFTAGSVLTAAQVNTYLMQQAVMVFTNEAARDAAITAPSEGMNAYLTAPTIPAATGTTAVTPTGARTIYNGSVWVCVTPVGAVTPAQGTSSNTAYTASLGGTPGTNPSVTLVTGTTAMISIRTFAAVLANTYALVSVAVSGASTVAASDDWSAYQYQSATNEGIVNSTTTMIYGLTAGTNTFTLQYKVSAATTASFSQRSMIVTGIA